MDARNNGMELLNYCDYNILCNRVQTMCSSRLPFE